MINLGSKLTNVSIDLSAHKVYNYLNRRVPTRFALCLRYNGVTSNSQGELVMTENEIELIEMIRNHKNPEKAFITALEIILVFLKHESREVS